MTHSKSTQHKKSGPSQRDINEVKQGKGSSADKKEVGKSKKGKRN